MKEPGPREILNAVRQMAVLVRLGYPLAEGLKNMAGDASPWLAKVADDMEQGDDLSSALARQPRLFSPLFRSLVEAAAANPQPDKVLEDLSCWLERNEIMQRKVASVLLYPMLLLALLSCFLALFISLILPEIVLPLLTNTRGQTFPQLAAALPWLTLLPLALLLLLGLSLLQGQPWPPLLWVFPEIRSLRNLANQALWARALGALLAAGVPVVEALEQALPILKDGDNLRQQLAQATSEARKGTPVAQALERCSLLERQLVWSLEGEDVAARVLEGADALEREIQLRCEQQLRLMGPRALILVAILCALAMLTFWWPFYQMTSSIQ